MRRRSSAIVGSAVFFLAAPCVVAGVLPWLILDRYRLPFSTNLAFAAAGWLLIGVAIVVLLHSFGRLALEGMGTPAPVAPTEKLVVGGIYRHVRNPMYVAVLSIIAGQALLFASLDLLLYGAVIAAAMVSFVHFYEEPTLSRRYGEEYDAYRHAVPGWLPRLTPWRGE
ncbi:methyltransferase family protein [Mesorhizobium retamae]|uniref:Isoprenylcysteine carboxylmethyltransferase family protein n=1 Tax=Mesorhizobium retamae TaxID=2912854 RepID=A0ABS9QGP3_9HYPH|nr:isoprenylcysteine carboxylmethyltransferase family protein [Mesorhizobium sp. IRAMC:0171]MCG7506619.1 isoprenylcysteine carboxylmethyltransferase family protein [Mesorhizobium sp. IRAMC:0171]